MSRAGHEAKSAFLSLSLTSTEYLHLTSLLAQLVQLSGDSSSTFPAFLGRPTVATTETGFVYHFYAEDPGAQDILKVFEAAWKEQTELSVSSLLEKLNKVPAFSAYTKIEKGAVLSNATCLSVPCLVDIGRRPDLFASASRPRGGSKGEDKKNVQKPVLHRLSFREDPLPVIKELPESPSAFLGKAT